MDAHIIFGVISVLNDNTCTPSIDALRTTHGDNSDLSNDMDAHIIFGVISVLNDNTCAPSIDALRTTHVDNS